MDNPYHRFRPEKILVHAERSLLPIIRGEMPYPLEWVVYPSNLCNHKCVFCLFRHPAPDGHIEQLDPVSRVQLPRDLLLRFVDDAARLGAVILQFEGGGEPLLNKHTREAIERASAAGLKVALSTNGRLLTPEVARSVDYIRVSLNAGTATQHWRTNHGGDVNDKGDWDIIVANIAAAVTNKKQDLGLAFVIDTDNYRDITPFCDLAVELGVDFVHIRPAFYYDPGTDAQIRALMPEALALCREAQKRHEGASTRIFALTDKFEGYWTPRTYHACLAIWTIAMLRATGDFAVCKDRTDLTYGHTPSYRKGATFEDVWYSEEHKAIAARIHDGAGGELTSCPRCVLNQRNELIDSLAKDDIRLALV